MDFGLPLAMYTTKHRKHIWILKNKTKINQAAKQTKNVITASKISSWLGWL